MSAKIHNCEVICNTSSRNTVNLSSPLDTLAQLTTRVENDDIQLCNTTRSDDKKLLLKRARRNYFSTALSTSLVSASESNPSSILRQSYWNTYHCNSVLVLRESGKITGTYCKNRWCMTCNAVRTAKSMNDYIPVIRNWQDAHMVTLTVPNCNASDLDNCIKKIHDCFIRIKKTITMQYARGKCNYQLVGVRKFECTYNCVSNTYHPHFHIILKEKRMAQRVYDEWLARNTDCSEKAQDVRKANLDSLQELFKYMTKVISNTGKEKVIYADAMDVIFNSMRGKRVLQNFGFRLNKNIDPFKVESDDSMITDVYYWQQSCADWINVEDGDLLTGYTPGAKFKELVENKIIARNTQKNK